MPYIGRLPSASPLSVDDITDGVVTTAKISDDAVTAAKINGLTASIAELNLTDGITADSTDLNRLDITTVGTAEASKALTTDSSNNITSSNSLTAGSLIGDGSGLTNLPPAGGSTTATANGAITNGDPVIIESAGTVAAVGETTSEVSPPTAGSVATLASGNPSGEGKRVATNGSDTVVQFITDTNNYGQLIAGTIASGATSVTYGTPVTVWTGAATGNASVVHLSQMAGGQTYLFVLSDTNATNIVRAFSVSGTTITLGTQNAYGFDTHQHRLEYDRGAGDRVFVGFYDGTSLKVKTLQVTGINVENSSQVTSYEIESSYGGGVNLNSDTSFDFSYDENADRLLVGVSGQAINSSTRTDNRLYVISRSGSVLSVNRTVDFSTRPGTYNNPFIEYDPTSQKHVILYADDTTTINVNYYRIATVNSANNTVSLGSEAAFTLFPNQFFRAGLAVDRNSGHVIFSGPHYPSPYYYAMFASAKVSGTSLNFGTEVEWLAEGTSDGHSIASLDDGRAIVRTVSSSGQKTAVITYSNTVTTLTSENFIGFVDADYADGATATIQLAGNIDDAQSGLTAGQQYFVQTDGTLGTTASNPSVKAGVALSATEILIDTGRV